MARVMIAAVFFVLIMTLGANAVNFQGEALGKQYQIENETNDPSGAGFTAGELVNLTNSQIDDAKYDPAQEIVILDASGIEMVEGDDYEWNRNNGSVTILANGDLVGESELTANYSFHIATRKQKDITTFVGNELTLATGLVYAFGAILGVSILRLLVGAT